MSTRVWNFPRRTMGDDWGYILDEIWVFSVFWQRSLLTEVRGRFFEQKSPKFGKKWLPR